LIEDIKAQIKKYEDDLNNLIKEEQLLVAYQIAVDDNKKAQEELEKNPESQEAQQAVK